MKCGVVGAEAAHIVDRPGDTGLVFACFEKAVRVPGVNRLILIKAWRRLAEFNHAQESCEEQDEQQNCHWSAPKRDIFGILPGDLSELFLVNHS